MYTARIRMPRMGTSVHESTVVAWKKAVGDAVAKGEVLLSAESDKVEFEVEAPADGVITEILADAEETVPVGEVLATMETETEVADETPVQDRGASDDWAAPVAPLQPREKPVIPAPQARKAPLPSDKKTWLSPRVQNLAAAHGVGLDVLAGIEGTGAGGRISARDVEAFIAGGGIPPRIEMSSEPLSENRDERVEPLSRIRKRIAENLTRSVREIPQVTSWLDVDMGGVSAFRDANKQAFYDKHGCRLTYTPFFIMALVHALRNADNERLNATYHRRRPHHQTLREHGGRRGLTGRPRGSRPQIGGFHELGGTLGPARGSGGPRAGGRAHVPTTRGAGRSRSPISGLRARWAATPSSTRPRWPSSGRGPSRRAPWRSQTARSRCGPS